LQHDEEMNRTLLHIKECTPCGLAHKHLSISSGQDYFRTLYEKHSHYLLSTRRIQGTILRSGYFLWLQLLWHHYIYKLQSPRGEVLYSYTLCIFPLFLHWGSLL